MAVVVEVNTTARMSVARYSFPDRVGISVMSSHHFRSGAVAVKSRFTRSGNLAALRSCLVKPDGACVPGR